MAAPVVRALLVSGLAAVTACAPLPAPKPADEDTACTGVWYRDTDGDGVGDARRGTASGCEAPDGYVGTDGDCDDLDGDVLPGAPERCDAVDQDCDGAFDEDAVDAPTWHADTDGDGFGAPGTGIVTCDAPGTHVADATDCDDTVATTFPGADELCDGVDQDCDGTVDEDAVDAPAWYADTDLDGFGDPAAPTLACDVPAGHVPDDTDCDDTDPLVSPAGTEWCGGGDEDCDGAVDEGDAADASTWYADADTDGYGDAAAPLAACEAPIGHVADATDCDDTDLLTSPAGTEVCGGADEDCDGTVDEDDAAGAPTWYADADTDGYGDAAAPLAACEAPIGHVADATDCDDTDPFTSPAAAERCGGADEDCDGVVDEDDAPDAATWYADTDADGFGDASALANGCAAPAGHVADATDCDDTDPLVSPAADEVCGGADEDCDGTVDEGDAIDATTWYADVDIDGRGDPATPLSACTRPSGYVDTGTDCDDTNPAAFPGLTETCATPFDDDCDGDGNEEGAIDCVEHYEDADGDGHGVPGTSLCLCTPASPYASPLADDCDDTDPAAWPEAPEVWGDGVDQSCDGDGDAELLASAGIGLYGAAAADAVGSAVAGAGDQDGDGYGDLLVGARGYSSGGATTGAAFLFLGPPAADRTTMSAALVLVGENPGDLAGCSVDAGDLDGDGAADLVVGASGSSADGLAYVVRNAGTGTYDLSSANLRIEGSVARGGAGAAVTFVGDLDGDGADELAVGAPRAGGGTYTPGAAYLFSAPPDGAWTTSAAAATLSPVGIDDELGSAFARVGDVDGDGLDDLALGAPGWGSGSTFPGGVFLYSGMPGDVDLDDADVFLEGESHLDKAGASLSSAGDIDGDGLPDLLVGAPSATGAPGHAYIVTAPASGLLTNARTVFTGAAWGRLGASVAGGYDIDGDGALDIVLGEPFSSSTAAGAAHVVFAPPAGALTLDDADATLAGHSGSNTGNAVALLGDVDGDGLADLLIGASADDAAGSNAGVAWFVPGR